ncbi:MAG: sulfatase [Ruthenibacterium sp.]
MKDKKPNLIYVFADQLRYSSLSCHGDPYIHTPHMDAFAAGSTELCNAVSGHPVCAPYRASLFTGKYTTSTGMVINEIRLNPNHRCLAHVLNEGGYKTAYIGKWHLYANQFGNHYDPKNSYIPQGTDRLGFDGYFAAYNFHHEYYGQKAYYHLNGPTKIYCDGYEPDVQTNLAMEQLEQLSSGEKPFALFLSIGTPHDPWKPENVPTEYYDRFKGVDFALPENYSPNNDPYADAWARFDDSERAQLRDWMKVYYAMIANLDDNFGRLMHKIQTLGLEQNSIIVFTSDHGEMFGAHGRHAKNIFYEEAVRIPFFMQWKGHLPTEKNDVCLNSVDIMPTLLEMLQLPIPQTVEGQSVYSMLQGKSEGKPEGALMMGTGATTIWEDGHEWRAYRTQQYTYAVYRKDGSELLFDHKNDPFEKTNLAQDEKYAACKQELRTKMLDKMRQIHDDFNASSYYEKNWVSKDRIIKHTATQKETVS